MAQNHSLIGGRAWPSKARECQQQGSVHTRDNGLFKLQRAAQGPVVCMGCSLLHTHKSSPSYRPETVTSLRPKSPGLIQAAHLAPHPSEGRKQTKPNPRYEEKSRAPRQCGVEAVSEAGTRGGRDTWFTTAVTEVPESGPASVPAHILGVSGSEMHSGQMVRSGGHHSRSATSPHADFCAGILSATLNKTEQENPLPERAHNHGCKMNGLDSDSAGRPRWQSGPRLRAADPASPSPPPCLQSELTSSSLRESPVHSVGGRASPEITREAETGSFTFLFLS